MTMEDIRALEEETKKELDEERSKVSLFVLYSCALSSGVELLTSSPVLGKVFPCGQCSQ